MTYFFDNNFSDRYVRAFKELKQDVVHLKEEFLPNTPDEDWIPIIGKRGWSLVSMDIRIKRNPQQRLLLEASGITSFMCVEDVVNLEAWLQFTWLVRAWPIIKKQRLQAGSSTTYRVTINRKIEVWR